MAKWRKWKQQHRESLYTIIFNILHNLCPVELYLDSGIYIWYTQTISLGEEQETWLTQRQSMSDITKNRIRSRLCKDHITERCLTYKWQHDIFHEGGGALFLNCSNICKAQYVRLDKLMCYFFLEFYGFMVLWFSNSVCQLLKMSKLYEPHDWLTLSRHLIGWTTNQSSGLLRCLAARLGF